MARSTWPRISATALPFAVALLWRGVAADAVDSSAWEVVHERGLQDLGDDGNLSDVACGDEANSSCSIMDLQQELDRLVQMRSDVAALRQQVRDMRDVQEEVEGLRFILDNEIVAGGERDNGLETGWMVLCTSLVMFMQLGFALVESGAVRAKSYRHVFLKNLLDFTLGMMLWYTIGYWIAFPSTWDGDIFDFAKFDLFYASSDARAFYFQSVFASTAITIVSGAMAERTRMEAYLAFVALCGGMIYSVVVRWSWGGGWMSQLEPSYHDFAGSGVVHATGGVAAFVGCSLVGPRAGRFDTDLAEDMDKYKPHSLDNVVVGTLILWFGWFGFNPGSTTSLLDGAADVASLAYLNTLICPAFGAMTMLVIGIISHKCSKLPEHEKPPVFQLGYVCNGILGSLVGITAGCDSTPPAYAPLVGILCGMFVYGWSNFMLFMKIDDPVDAVAVHGCCGIWGVIMIGLFDINGGLVTTGDPALIVTQITCASAIVGYVGGTAFVYFYIVHAYGFLRMNMALEVMGIDYAEFGEGMHRDVTELEVKALENYRKDLLERLQGDVWGITEEVAMEFAKSHRRMTVTFLTIAIFYNYFYYIYFEWRGWEFFSIVNLLVGFQGAAAAHAEFKCKPGEARIRFFCIIVIMISLGLSVLNFVIAPHDNLILAWLRMMTLSLGWSVWMHLRVHPVDWEAVCNAENAASKSGSHSNSKTYMSSLFGVGTANSVFEYVVGLITAGRFQHIVESTAAFASVTSDLWVGLDELMNGPMLLGIVMVTFSLLQMTGVIGKLVVATATRNLNFVRIVTLITWCAETPVMILVLVSADSEMKWVSVTLSLGTLIQQMFMLILWTVYDKYLKRQEIAMKASPDEEKLPTTQLKPWPADYAEKRAAEIALKSGGSDVDLKSGGSKSADGDAEAKQAARERLAREQQDKQAKIDLAHQKKVLELTSTQQWRDTKPVPETTLEFGGASRSQPRAASKVSTPLPRPFTGNAQKVSPGTPPATTPTGTPRGGGGPATPTETPTTPLVGTPREEAPSFGAPQNAPTTPR